MTAIKFAGVLPASNKVFLCRHSYNRDKITTNLVRNRILTLDG
jgi:hypothetical protein